MGRFFFCREFSIDPKLFGFEPISSHDIADPFQTKTHDFHKLENPESYKCDLPNLQKIDCDSPGSHFSDSCVLRKMQQDNLGPSFLKCGLIFICGNSDVRTCQSFFQDVGHAQWVFP